MRRLALALTVLLFAPLAHALKITTTLPAFTRKAEVKAARNSDGRIERIRQKYLQRAKAGELDHPSDEKVANEKALLDFAKAINEKLRKQKDDRPILLIVEGPDGAGKSSTMARLAPVFKGIKQIDETHFGAPPKDAEDVHWAKRFIESLPSKGGVMMWDRSYIGRAVYDVHYGFSDKALRKETLREIRDLEGLLRDKVRIVKFYMDTPGENLAKTIAKREVTAPEKLSDSDYLSYKDRKVIKKLFKKAIGETGREVKWHVVDMSDRFKGRMKMLKVLERELL